MYFRTLLMSEAAFRIGRAEESTEGEFFASRDIRVLYPSLASSRLLTYFAADEECKRTSRKW
jgi:hypothetical protein